MNKICEKCKKNNATLTLEITLIKICDRCYIKILEARIKNQLKKTKKVVYEIHPFSLNFFRGEQCKLFKEKIDSMQQKREYISSENPVEPPCIKLLFATKEHLAILLIEYLSPNTLSIKNKISKIMLEIKKSITIVPFAQFSLKELNILFEELSLQLKLDNTELDDIHKMILDLEKTHKDSSSGLAKSFLEICSLFPEKEQK